MAEVKAKDAAPAADEKEEKKDIPKKYLNSYDKCMASSR